jgi:hypothetical protein
MDCDRIPAPDLWDNQSSQNLKEYRLHIQFCSACRDRVLNEAPEKLLFDLSEEPLPEEFWLGFWDSVARKRTQPQSRRVAEKLDQNSAPLRLSGRAYPILRWVGVILFGSFILLYGRALPEPNATQHLASLSLKTPTARSVEFSIKLMVATKSDQSPVSKQIKYIGNTGDSARFYNYALLDDGMVTSIEGRPAGLYLAREYQVRFLTDTIQEKEGIIRLKNFELRKIRRGKGGKDPVTPLISANLNLRNAETAILGASKVDESDQTILIILLGKVKK